MSASEQTARGSLPSTRPVIGEREVDTVADALRARQLGSNGAAFHRQALHSSPFAREALGFDEAQELERMLPLRDPMDPTDVELAADELRRRLR